MRTTNHLLIALLLVSGPVLATKPGPKPETAADGPTATAGAVSSAEATGGPNTANAYSAPSEASNEGISVSDASRFLSVGLAGVAGAARAMDCHESYGGKSGLGIGTGGRSVINEGCLTHEQCLQRVRLYSDLGEKLLALQELEDCGGQPAPESVSFPDERERRIRESDGQQK